MQADGSEIDQGNGTALPSREAGRREINWVHKEPFSPEGSPALWGFVVRELGTGRRSSVKPSEPEWRAGLVFMIMNGSPPTGRGRRN